jgi:hypothetical protein
MNTSLFIITMRFLKVWDSMSFPSPPFVFHCARCVCVYIVAFTKVLTMHQIHHIWIHFFFISSFSVPW